MVHDTLREAEAKAAELFKKALVKAGYSVSSSGDHVISMVADPITDQEKKELEPQ